MVYPSFSLSTITILGALLLVSHIHAAVTGQPNIQNPLVLPHLANTPFQTSKPKPETCQQYPAISPSRHKDLDRSLEELYNSETFQVNAIKNLGTIVRVPYVMFTSLDLH